MQPLTSKNLSSIFKAINEFVRKPILESFGQYVERLQLFQEDLSADLDKRFDSISDKFKFKQNLIEVGQGLTLRENILSLESAGLLKQIFPFLWESTGGKVAGDRYYSASSSIYMTLEEAMYVYEAGPFISSETSYSDCMIRTNLPPVAREAFVWHNTFLGNPVIEEAVLAPKSVIGSGCFCDCTSLRRITAINMPIERINNEVYDPRETFRNCMFLESVEGRVYSKVEEDLYPLCFNESPMLLYSNFEYWIDESPVNEDNFDEYQDVPVSLHHYVINQMLGEETENVNSASALERWKLLPQRLADKHILVCNEDGTPLIER